MAKLESSEMDQKVVRMLASGLCDNFVSLLDHFVAIVRNPIQASEIVRTGARGWSVSRDWPILSLRGRISGAASTLFVNSEYS